MIYQSLKPVCYASCNSGSSSKSHDVTDADLTAGDLRARIDLVTSQPCGGGLPDQTSPIAPFSFEFAGLLIDAEVVPGPEPKVRLGAELGTLPFTVEAAEPRRWILRILEKSRTLQRGSIELGRDGMIRLRAEIEPTGPAGPVGVLAAVTTLVLDFKPYLELLAELFAACPRNFARAY